MSDSTPDSHPAATAVPPEGRHDCARECAQFDSFDLPRVRQLAAREICAQCLSVQIRRLAHAGQAVDGDLLTSLVTHHDPKVVSQALSGLYHLGVHPPTAELEDLAYHLDSRVRVLALLHLGKDPAREVRSHLVALSRAEDPSVRARSIFALGELAGREGVEEILIEARRTERNEDVKAWIEGAIQKQHRMGGPHAATHTAAHAEFDAKQEGDAVLPATFSAMWGRPSAGALPLPVIAHRSPVVSPKAPATRGSRRVQGMMVAIAVSVVSLIAFQDGSGPLAISARVEHADAAVKARPSASPGSPPTPGASPVLRAATSGGPSSAPEEPEEPEESDEEDSSEETEEHEKGPVELVGEVVSRTDRTVSFRCAEVTYVLRQPVSGQPVSSDVRVGESFHIRGRLVGQGPDGEPIVEVVEVKPRARS